MNDIFNENVPLKTETPAFAKHVLGAVPSVVYNEDCVQGLKRYADNHFDLAIVDPPYGIGASADSRVGGSYTVNLGGVKKKVAAKAYTPKDWDFKKPTLEYWNELKRVSKNQIVWGANHFIERMPYNASGWIVWDKDNGESYQADCELAWTSFDKAVRKFSWRWWGLLQQNMKDKEIRIHPTQKPVALYKWILDNYANEGDLILDTHLGSGSIRLACNELKFPFTGFELDKDYYEAQEKRFNDFKSQLRLF
jgi:site-specific DNA-methyltransferase (adenine-specific)